MSIKTIAAGVLAALPMLAVSASAGDLGGYPEPRSYEQSGDYYVPPRRADVAGCQERRDCDLPPPPPVRGSYKDDPLPPPPPVRFEERRSSCIPRHIVRERLVSRGWHDFHDPVLRGDIAIFRARARSGDMYVLKIHRCTGEIVDSYADVPLRTAPVWTVRPYYYGVYGYGYGRHGHHRRHW